METLWSHNANPSCWLVWGNAWTDHNDIHSNRISGRRQVKELSVLGPVNVFFRKKKNKYRHALLWQVRNYVYIHWHLHKAFWIPDWKCINHQVQIIWLISFSFNFHIWKWTLIGCMIFLISLWNTFCHYMTGMLKEIRYFLAILVSHSISWFSLDSLEFNNAQA